LKDVCCAIHPHGDVFWILKVIGFFIESSIENPAHQFLLDVHFGGQVLRQHL
jgi:hypothetical protein